MRQIFYQTISQKKLWKRTDKLLLAVSGGVDSMVMLHLCSFLHNDIAVAHCNFRLRGADADGDEQHVKTVCDEMGINCHTIAFDTISYAKERGISIEMAARDLRYDFFENICKTNGYDKILTAHHANDNAETILLNLIKGTGVRGLMGIPSFRDNIVRPLLVFTRAELEKYASQNNISYRVDATNMESIYTRNKLRNEVIPLLEGINPSVVKTLSNNIERFSDLWSLYDENIIGCIDRLAKNDIVEIADLKKEKYLKSIVYEWLRPYRFPSNIAEEVCDSLNNKEEKVFYASEFRLVKSRDRLYLLDRENSKNESFSITEQGINEPIKLQIEKLKTDIEILKEKNIAYIDTSKIRFPLLLRRWKKGDRFTPFGLKGSKNISKVFKDLKYSKMQKEQAWVLCSEDKIVWLVGERMSNDFRVTEQTKSIIKISLIS